MVCTPFGLRCSTSKEVWSWTALVGLPCFQLDRYILSPATFLASSLTPLIKVGCALSVACEAAMVAEYSGTPNRVGNGFGVLFQFMFVSFYGSCVDAISCVYCAELSPMKLRAQGVAACIMGLFAMTLSKETCP